MDLSDITRERDRSRQTEITSLPVCTVSASYNLDLSVFAKHSALSSSGSHVQQKSTCLSRAISSLPIISLSSDNSEFLIHLRSSFCLLLSFHMDDGSLIISHLDFKVSVSISGPLYTDSGRMDRSEPFSNWFITGPIVPVSSVLYCRGSS
jgi:hypothetical protein